MCLVVVRCVSVRVTDWIHASGTRSDGLHFLSGDARYSCTRPTYLHPLSVRDNRTESNRQPTSIWIG